VRLVINKYWSKIIIFLIALLPMAFMIWLAASNHLGPDPAKKLALITGEWALRFVLLTLLISSLSRASQRLRFLLQFRRMIGLFAFFYASVHLFVFISLILGFDATLLLAEINKRPYITVGVLAWVAMLPLALTSNAAAIKKLGARQWKQLHRLVYLSLFLAILHLIWQVRSDWSDALLYSTLAMFLGVERIRSMNKKQP